MSSIECVSASFSVVLLIHRVAVLEDRPHSGLWHSPLCGVCHTPLCTVARGMVFVVFERASVPRCFSLSVGRFFVLREH